MCDEFTDVGGDDVTPEVDNEPADTSAEEPAEIQEEESVNEEAVEEQAIEEEAADEQILEEEAIEEEALQFANYGASQKPNEKRQNSCTDCK